MLLLLEISGRGRGGRGRGRGEAVINEVPVVGMVNEMESSSMGHEQLSTSANEVVNCAPTINLLPPEKSKRKGRPRKHTYKSPLDIAVKKSRR